MNEKLHSWLVANKFNVNKSKIEEVKLFLFSHHARALICVYIVSHSRNKYHTLIIRKFLRSHYHIECSCRQIGYRLMLPHPRNIIIVAESIGDNVQVNQNVTIGGNMHKKKQREWGEQKLPIIGNNVVVYTNAVVGGPIIIEDNVIIGANCTCTHDIPANTLVYNKQYISSRKIKVLEGTYTIFKQNN